MLEKPDLPDENLISCLQDSYGLRVNLVEFLPVGADQHTAVYRATTVGGAPYFVRLRGGSFNEVSITLPKFLSEQGINQVVPPLPARNGQLWVDLAHFKLVVFPFIAGCNGYEAALSDRHWIELGEALRRVHAVRPPPAILQRLRREDWSPTWREKVKFFLDFNGRDDKDPITEELASCLRTERLAILELVERAGRLARVLQDIPLEIVVCHADVHAGNVLIDWKECLYIMDWDDSILAPKERDLMYAGGGQFANWRAPHEEESLFYQGYGEVQVQAAALAYYRYERIIEDIGVECEQIFLHTVSGGDRQQALRYLQSNFLPAGVLDIACLKDLTRLES
jgi:spectinomycin phosphotransferase